MYSNTTGYGDRWDQRPQPALGQPAMPWNNPPTGLHPRTNNVPWSHGLCDYFGDLTTCCLSYWCPCVTFGRIAEIVDEGSTSFGTSGALYTLIFFITGCACCYSCFYRSKMRNRYQLQERPCSDFLVHWCCETCALTQEYRELKQRGFDMLIGWQGNINRQSHGITMVPTAPVVQGGMMR